MPNIKHLYICLFIFSGILLFKNNEMTLWEQDEAAYSGFAQTMNRTADYLIPNFIWSDQHRKTPLHFWTIAVSYKLFGENDFATRLPTNLALITLVFVIYFITKRLFNKEIAIISSIVFMTGLFPILYGKIAFTDGLLLLLEGASVLLYILWVIEKRWVWILLLNISISLALLTKGPPIVIMMGSIIGLQIIFCKDRFFTLKSIFYLIPSLIPLSIWLYKIHLIGRDDFLSWLLDWYILKRTSGTVFGQTGPIGYFSILFLASFFIFSPFLWNSILCWWKRLKMKEPITLLFLFALPGSWFLYELLPSKLPSYSLAAYPILSIGLGRYLFESNKKNWILPLIIIAVLTISFFIPKSLPNVMIANSLQWSIILIFITIILVYIIPNSLQYVYSGLGLIIIFILSLNIFFLENERHFTKVIAEKFANHQQFEPKIYFTKNFEIPGIAAYLQRKNIDYQLDTTIQNKRIYLADDENISKYSEMQKIDSIKGWISDRGKNATFYFLMK